MVRVTRLTSAPVAAAAATPAVPTGQSRALDSFPRATFVHPDGRGHVDPPTVAGIAALVYVVSTLLHEAAGHGLACLAVGAPPRVWGAYYFDCDFRGLPWSAGGIVAAAGSTVNLVVAFLCLAVWPHTRDRSPAVRLLVWLAFTVSAFQWAGYFLYSGVSGAGDWGTDGVLSGVVHAPHARVVMVAVGGFFYYWWINRRSARMLSVIVGGTPTSRRIGQRVGLTAYAVGGVVALLVGLRNPIGLPVILGSAVASSLGGTFGLPFVAAAMPRDSRHAGPSLARGWPWIVAGAAAAIAYAVVLGPSITFGK